MATALVASTCTGSICKLSIDRREEERINIIDQELVYASVKNNPLAVRRLLRAGADVNAKDNNDRTPLDFACKKGHVQVFKELLEHGADIEANDIHGRTALHLACSYGHLAVVNELLSPNDSNGATTSILGKSKSRAGANTEAKDSEGNMPLHYATSEGHFPVVKSLLSRGADILAVHHYGRLPIHFAVSQGRSEVSKYLLREFYALIHRLPLHELLNNLTWIGDPNSSDVPPLHAALDKCVGYK
jgi:ankyrin repeat protein